MINSNLILVDGLSGSGKSTTTQRLYLHLLRLGHDVQWFYEHDTAHPILPYQEIEAALDSGAEGAQQLLEVALVRWQALTEKLAGSQTIYLLESVLFQSNGLLALCCEWDQAQMKAYVAEIYQRIAPLNPQLLYLRRQEIAQSLLATLAQRDPGYAEQVVYRLNRTTVGKKNPFASMEQVVELFQQHQDSSDSIVDELGLSALTIENSAGLWADYEAQICHFLDLPPFTEFATPFADLSPFVGRYKDHQSDDVFTVGDDGRHLYMDFGANQARLYYKADCTFCLQGMSLELTFEKNASGEVDRFACHANLPGLSQLWVKI